MTILKSTFAVPLLVVAFIFSFAIGNISRAEEETFPPTESVVTEEVVAPVETIEVTEPVVEDTTVTEEVVVPTEEVTQETTQVATPTLTPELSTDKEDYHPGETASIFGKFFNSLTDIVLKVFGSDENDENYTEQVQNVTSDENGGFETSYTLDDLYRPFYEVYAYATDGVTELASTWFRDSAVHIYNQCANDDGDGYGAPDPECHWINGAINSSNSTYFEGDSTIHRAWLDGFAPSTSHTVTFKYGTTKGGKHAYDYLTTYNATEVSSIADRCDGITGCTTATEVTSAMQNDLLVDDTIEPAPAGRLFTLRGGTITNVSVPSMVSGSYASDSETVVTVTFTTGAQGSSMCEENNGPHNTTIVTCGVAIWFGAHIAESAEWMAFNSTTGAGSINGSPYHVALVALDNEDQTQGGGHDNQMSADVLVVPTQATLTLLKTVVNDNGGTALDTAWTLSANGPTPISGTEGQAAVTAALVDAGDYTLSESGGPAGYTGETYSCVVNGGNPVVSNTLTLAPDDVAVCTITNNDIAPTLKLVKTVTNDNGGTAVANDWDLTATGSGGFTEPTPALVDATVHNVTAGINYALSESGPSGYTASAWSCTDGDNDGTVNLALDEDVVCTINNDDQQAYVTVTKVVNNTHGGTAGANDFNLTLEGNAVSSGVAVPVNPGTYTAGETLLSGYQFDGFTEDCDSNGDVTVALGQSKTCTLTNSDKQSYLTVVKLVIDENGGNENPDDFNLKIDNDGVLSGAQTPVNPGQHTVSETQLPGYTFEGFVEDSEDFPNDCAQNGTVTVALGESKICTLANNDIAPTLTIVKNVVNDDGGTATVVDFDLELNAVNLSFGAGVPNGNTTTYTSNPTVLANNQYSLSEADLAGYEEGTFSCTDDDTNLSVALPLTLNEGQKVTCAITNNDIAPKLTLEKTVVNDNGGQATESNFQAKVDGNNVAWDAENTYTVGSHSASEVAGVTGYAAGAWGGDCAADGSITLALGDDKTCTITNDDISPTLTVIKQIVPETDSGLFNLRIDGSTAGSGANVGDNGTSGAVPVNAGQHTVSETAGTDTVLGDYTAVISGDCASDGTVSLALAENKTCTITNTKKATLTVVKNAVPNDCQDFSFAMTGQDNFLLDDSEGVQACLDTDQPVSKNFLSLVPGNVTVTETLPNQFWQLGGVACTGNAADETSIANGVTVTLGAGENVTCTFTNNKLGPTRTQGFWKNHTAYSTSILNTIVNGIVLGTKTVDTQGELFGGWEASIPKKVQGGKRTALDSARITMLHQYLAAKLNCAAFGCSITIQTLLGNAATAWSGTDAALLLNYASQLDAYNNSGDTIILVGTPGKATPKTSSGVATPAFWDVLP
jgi:hypothetical protein